MKRWNWWLAWKVLRGSVNTVTYHHREKELVVELHADAEARRHVAALRPR